MTSMSSTEVGLSRYREDTESLSAALANFGAGERPLTEPLPVLFRHAPGLAARQPGEEQRFEFLARGDRLRGVVLRRWRLGHVASVARGAGPGDRARERRPRRRGRRERGRLQGMPVSPTVDTDRIQARRQFAAMKSSERTLDEGKAPLAGTAARLEPIPKSCVWRAPSTPSRQLGG